MGGVRVKLVLLGIGGIISLAVVLVLCGIMRFIRQEFI